MKQTFPTRLLLVSAFLYSGSLYAVSDSAAQTSGFTLFSDQPNINHWGLGIGAKYEQSPYSDYGSEFSPLPLIYVENNWLRLFGNNLDVKAGQWDNLKFALHSEYAFGDGYKGSDATVLNDMQKRSGGFWVGPSVTWDTEIVTLYADYLFAGNKGQKAKLGAIRKFDYGDITIAPYADVAWLNDKYVDYYYGVRPAEARPGRDAYDGKSTYAFSAGLNVSYALTAHQSLSLDASVTRFGSGIDDSPLVDKTTIPQVTVGYLYHF
ncbi:MipA/OmpV family protein [Erwiniaceae bacterium BAC15a-03b]|uniref:MipA/OmpV family protein n=1 Tax=Winslowiella arboricola TaxID=2978220 RepID=A0A9J6PGF8_9GAMM|nr:MipA/OmpV family protein [Winslowiella arboricola]MCU5771637.1 MipA/OmpV family protein [Winslowiella arboricola]MCU5776450.1 MipA/OmpV family protein [Winslowiella arboricola]